MGNFIRATLATVAIFLAGWISWTATVFYVHAQTLTPVQAQAIDPIGGLGLPPIWSFAIQQSGAVAVLLVVLFFYRRDYQMLVGRMEARESLLMDLVRENTRVTADAAAAIREAAVVMHQTKNVMAKYLPERRDDWGLGGGSATGGAGERR